MSAIVVGTPDSREQANPCAFALADLVNDKLANEKAMNVARSSQKHCDFFISEWIIRFCEVISFLLCLLIGLSGSEVKGFCVGLQMCNLTRTCYQGHLHSFPLMH